MSTASKCTQCDGSGMIDAMCHNTAGCCIYPCRECVRRARLVKIGIDGNAGFALQGENLQEGESEFIEVPSPGREPEKIWAANAAYLKLKARISPNEDLPYEYDESHPCKCNYGV